MPSNGERTPPSLARIMGVAEIAEYAGVQTSTVVNWRTRHEDFPKPIARLRMGEVYDTDDVLTYLNTHGYPRSR